MAIDDQHPGPTKGTPTMTKEPQPIETINHDAEAILTIRNKTTGEVELFHIETGIVTEQTGGKPNHVLTIASDGWKTHALHGTEVAAETWNTAKSLLDPTPSTTAATTDPDKESPRLETPPPTFPKYVMLNGGWNGVTKLLRRHEHPDHAGEYTEYAAGPHTKIRQLLEDLNNE